MKLLSAVVGSKLGVPSWMRVASAALLCVALAACQVSKKNSDDPDDPDDPTSSKTFELRGAVVKGIVRNADVQLFEYAQSTFANPMLLASTTTDDSGRYQLTVQSPAQYHGGAVLVRIKGKPSGSQARCDVDLPNTSDDCGAAVAFGTFYAIDESFVLETSLPALLESDADTTTTTLNASVFTNLVSARAAALRTGSTRSLDAIRIALSQVNQLAGGIDVVRTTPVDLSDATAIASATPEGVAYGALNSGLLRLASQAAPGGNAATNTNAAIDRLDTLFGPAASISDADLQAIADAGRAQLAVAGQTDAAGVFAVIDRFIAQPGDTVSYSATVAPTDGVTAAKDFVGDIRTVMQTYRTALDPADNAFAQQLSMAKQISGEATTNLFLDIEPAIDCTAALVRQDYADRVIALPDGCVSTGNNRFAVGGATIVKGNDGTRTNFAVNGTVGTSTLALTLSYPSNGANAPGSALDAMGSALEGRINGRAATASSTGVALQLDGVVQVLTRDAGRPVFTDATISNINQVTLSFDASFTQKGVTNPLTALGSIDLSLVRCTTSSCVPSGPGEIEPFFVDRFVFSGGVGDTQNNRLIGSIDVDIRNPRDFNAFSEDYSASNFVDGSLTLTLEAALPNRPVAQVVLTVDSTGYDNASRQPLGSVTLALMENGQITLRAQSRSTQQLPGFANAIEVTNSNGFVLGVTAGPDGDTDNIVGVLTADGVPVANVSPDSGAVLIRYADNSFETLFF